MSWMIKSRSAGVWALLVLITFFSWESGTLSADHRTVSSVILGLAFFKVWIIGLEFMELREAPLALRIAFEAWVVAICALLLALYWQVIG